MSLHLKYAKDADAISPCWFSGISWAQLQHLGLYDTSNTDDKEERRWLCVCYQIRHKSVLQVDELFESIFSMIYIFIQIKYGLDSLIF